MERRVIIAEDYDDEVDSSEDGDSVPQIPISSREAIEYVKRERKFGIAHSKIDIKEIYESWEVIG